MADEEGEQRAHRCLGCLRMVLKPFLLECGHALCLPCLPCLGKQTHGTSCCSQCWEFSQLKTGRAGMAMPPEGEGMCGLHREEQKLFCDHTKSLLCMSCSQAEEHVGHIHWAIPVAALRYTKLLQAQVHILESKEKNLQELLLQEQQQPLAWAVVWPQHKEKGARRAWSAFLRRWGSLERKKDKAEKQGLQVLRRHKRLMEVYERLKEMEASQQDLILKAKKEWEAMLCSQSSLLTDRIRELKEAFPKPAVELLRDVAATLHRRPEEPHLEPFLLQVDASYLSVVTEFLQLFQSYHRGDKYTHYDLSEEHQRAIHILPGFSGKTYTAYTTGSVEAEATIRQRAFIVHPQAQQEVAAEEEET